MAKIKSPTLPESRSSHGLAGNGNQPKASPQRITISAPNMQTAVFDIKGTAPLVVHRFSKKVKEQIIAGMVEGSTTRKNTKKPKLDPQANYNQARYISPEGWDGFNAASLRCALISACRLVGFKMTIAKLSLFVVADGIDATEPEYQLIRINGTPRLLESMGRLDNGSVCPIHRPCYDEWTAKLRVRFDADQFTSTDVANLLMRVGEQVGLGEGRPDSKNSAGMGWGTFKIVEEHNEEC